MSQDKTAEQLRACREAFEKYAAGHVPHLSFHKRAATSGNRFYEDARTREYFGFFKEAWNTRADSGEAVAVGRLIIDLSRWQVVGFHDAISRLPLPAGEYDLFTHPRATSVDVRDAERWQAFKRYVSETIGGNHLLDRLAVLDIGAWDQCIDELKAAIASRDGE